jgi:hypothetical protein
MTLERFLIAARYFDSRDSLGLIQRKSRHGNQDLR